MIEHKIEPLVLAKFEEEAWEDCFIVEIKHKGNKLNVFIDSDSSMSFDKCRKVSRHIEAILDEELWLGERYTLEVSSPGIGRPLKMKRQYVKNIGRTIALKIGDDTDEGLLTSVQEDGITIEKEVVIKEGKKKRKEIVTSEIPFDTITEAKVKISFKKKKK